MGRSVRHVIWSSSGECLIGVLGPCVEPKTDDKVCSPPACEGESTNPPPRTRTSPVCPRSTDVPPGSAPPRPFSLSLHDAGRRGVTGSRRLEGVLSPESRLELMSARAKLAVETDECAAARHVHGQHDVTLEGHEIARAYAHYN